MLDDLAQVPRQVVSAFVIQGILLFGLDVMAVVGFCLCLRRGYGFGLGSSEAHQQQVDQEIPEGEAQLAGSQQCEEETLWLCSLAFASIERANEYLISEHVGSLDLADLLEGL